MRYRSAELMAHCAREYSKPRRPVVRYPGGKWRLAPWIIAHMPPHRIYVEPFGGSASVLMRKARAYAEVYNDQWGRIVDVFRVLRDPALASDLRRQIELTPFSRREFQGISDASLAQESSLVERARMTIYRSFAAFGSASVNGDQATGFRSSSKRSGTIPAHDWAGYPDQIPAFVDRLRGVVIESKPAAEVITAHDSPETLIYADPPYPHSTRNMNRGNARYAHEMSDDDHRALAAVLKQVKGMVVLSGYGCEFYDRELYPDWTRIEKAAYADGAQKRTEVLWMNPQCAQNMQHWGQLRVKL